MAKVRVLLGAGLLETKDVIKISCSLKTSKIVAVIYDDEWGPWRRLKNPQVTFEGAVTIKLSSLLETPKYGPNLVSIRDLSRVILADPNALLIAERLRMGGYFASYSKRVFLIESIIINVVSWIEELKIEKFVQTNIPHGYDWYLAKVFEHLGLAVYYTRVCLPIPRVQLIHGLNNPSILEVSSHPGDLDASNLAKSIIEGYKGSYKDVLPNYEKEIIRKRGVGMVSLRSVINDIRSANSLLKLIWIFGSAAGRYLAYKNYRKVISVPTSSSPVVKFFLHYQPEATTIPAGGWYAVQHNAIRELGRFARNLFQLAIREHPNTFRQPFDKRFRWPNFHRYLVDQSDIIALDVENDVFEELKGCAAVVTITGAIGFEAICRGVPCLIFSNTFYEQLEGVILVDKGGVNQDTINMLLSKQVDQNLLMASLKKLLSHSFEYETRINGSLSALVYLCEQVNDSC